MNDPFALTIITVVFKHLFIKLSVIIKEHLNKLAVKHFTQGAQLCA